MKLQEMYDRFKSNGYHVGQWYIDLGETAFIEMCGPFVTIQTIVKPYVNELLLAKVNVKNIKDITFSDTYMKILVENDIGTVQIEVKL